MGFRTLTAPPGAVLSGRRRSRARARRRDRSYPHRPPGFRTRMAPDRRARPPAERSLVLGVLGGISSGKSTAARLLAGPEGVVISADELAREALDSPAVLARVRERFGAEVVGPDGRADRAALARLVFDGERCEELRRELESWTHPLVRARIEERLSAARAAGVPRIVLDVPLLLENDAQHGLGRLCDVLVFVDVHAAERERRARRDRGWKSGEVARREATQLPLSEKKKRAHHILSNNQGLGEL